MLPEEKLWVYSRQKINKKMKIKKSINLYSGIISFHLCFRLRDADIFWENFCTWFCLLHLSSLGVEQQQQPLYLSSSVRQVPVTGHPYVDQTGCPRLFLCCWFERPLVAMCWFGISGTTVRLSQCDNVHKPVAEHVTIGRGKRQGK